MTERGQMAACGSSRALFRMAAALSVCAIAAACVLALAMPQTAEAYDYYYKVWTADGMEDENLVYDSETGYVAESIAAEKLMEGVWVETYYNGRVDPLPSVTVMSSWLQVVDSSTGEVVSSASSSASLAGNVVGGIDYDRSDCTTVDEYGNTIFQFDDDGYFSGILYRVTFYEIDGVSVGSDVEFSLCLVPYLEGVGSSEELATLQTFTLSVTSSGEEGKAAGEEEAERTGRGEDGSSSAESGAASSEDPPGARDSTATAAGSGDGGQSGAGSDADASAGFSSVAGESDSAGESSGSAAEGGGSGGGKGGAGSGAEASEARETLESLGSVFALSSDDVQESELSETVEVTGWPWPCTLIVALLAASVPAGFLSRLLQRRRGVCKASRLVGV